MESKTAKKHQPHCRAPNGFVCCCVDGESIIVPDQSISDLIAHLSTTDARFYPDHANSIMKMAKSVLENILSDAKQLHTLTNPLIDQDVVEIGRCRLRLDKLLNPHDWNKS